MDRDQYREEEDRYPGNQEESAGSRAEINHYMQELVSLKHGERAVAKLIACGCPAIEPLRWFLLTGEPGVVYHIRRWAVEALAGLGARDVLLEYLKQEKDIPDPAVRLGEEAVESAAAKQLIRWPSEEAFQVLAGIAQERCLPGALEALGEFKRAEAIPALVKALGDDVCRPTAEDALLKIGPLAEPVLIKAATAPYPDRASEKPSSLLRRRSATGLLAEIGVSEGKWVLLRPLLDEDDEEILVAAFRIAGRIAEEKDRRIAYRRLIKIIENGDWYVKGEAEDALLEQFGMIKNTIEEEVARRRERSKGKWNLDPVVGTFLNVKRRAEQEKTGKSTS